MLWLKKKSLPLVCLGGLLFWFALTFWWQLGSTGLVDETEPLFAEAARQMDVTGNWITPYFDGHTRFDKPPLIYWLMALGYQVLGVNSWAVRLPSALAATALMGLLAYTLYRCTAALHPDRPWLAAGIGGTMGTLNLLVLVWSRTGVADMLLSGCLGGALLTFFLAYSQPQLARKTYWYLGSYLLMGLAVLTKGPVGVVLPGLIISSFLWYVGQGRAIRREMHLGWGVLVMGLVCVPWYVLATWQNGPAFLENFFGYQNAYRFLHVIARQTGPWYFYLIVLALGFAPWSVYLPLAITHLQPWRRYLWQQQPRAEQLGLFAIFWCGGVLLFFTLAATKLPSYILPLIPAAAILVTGLFLTPSPRGMRLSALVNLGLWGLGAEVLFWGPHWLPDTLDPAMPHFPTVLIQSLLPLRAALVAVAGVLGVGLALGRRAWGQLWLANALSCGLMVGLFCLPFLGLIDQERQLPLRQLSAIIRQVQRPGESLVMYGVKKPSVVFYTHEPINYSWSKPGLIHRLQEDAHQLDPPTSLLLSQAEKLSRVGLQPDQYQVLAYRGAYVLVRLNHQALGQTY